MSHAKVKGIVRQLVAIISDSYSTMNQAQGPKIAASFSQSSKDQIEELIGCFSIERRTIYAIKIISLQKL